MRNVYFLADIDIHADLGICFMDAICTVAKEAPHNGQYEVVSKSDCFDSEGRAWGYYGDKTTCDSQEYLGKFSSEAVGKKYVHESELVEATAEPQRVVENR